MNNAMVLNKEDAMFIVCYYRDFKKMPDFVRLFSPITIKTVLDYYFGR
jgi:hypothetical protein